MAIELFKEVCEASSLLKSVLHNPLLGDFIERSNMLSSCKTSGDSN
jgi:hypothetical protein